MLRRLSERHGSHAGKSPRGIGSGRIPASDRVERAHCVGVLRRRSAEGARPVAARARHCRLSDRFAVNIVTGLNKTPEVFVTPG